MLLCWCNPPRFGSLFKTSPIPGDDEVTKPRAQAHARPVTLRVTGTQGRQPARPPKAPPVHLLSTSSHQWVSGWPLRLHRDRARPSLGGGSVTQSHLPTGLQGEPYPTGEAVVSFFLFFFFSFSFSFCPLGCPQPESQDHLNWRGSREGGVVRWSVPDSTGNISFSKTAPTRAS